MARTFDKTLLLGIGLIVALHLGNLVLAYRNTRLLFEDAGWAAHTQEVLDRTSDVLRLLVDAETGQRGFIISGDERFSRTVPRGTRCGQSTDQYTHGADGRQPLAAGATRGSATVGARALGSPQTGD